MIGVTQPEKIAGYPPLHIKADMEPFSEDTCFSDGELALRISVDDRWRAFFNEFQAYKDDLLARDEDEARHELLDMRRPLPGRLGFLPLAYTQTVPFRSLDSIYLFTLCLSAADEDDEYQILDYTQSPGHLETISLFGDDPDHIRAISYNAEVGDHYFITDSILPIFLRHYGIIGDPVKPPPDPLP